MVSKEKIRKEAKTARVIATIGTCFINPFLSFVGGIFWFSTKSFLGLLWLIVFWGAVFLFNDTVLIMVILLSTIHATVIIWQQPWEETMKKYITKSEEVMRKKEEEARKKRTLREKARAAREKKRREIKRQRQEKLEAAFEEECQAIIENNDYQGLSAICKSCGYEWTIRKQRGIPATCPRCHSKETEVNWTLFKKEYFK